MPRDLPFIEVETKPNPVADTLRRAKALIDTPEKWCKTALERDGAFCIAGAINHVAGGRSCAFREGDPIVDFVGRANGLDGWHAIIEFNNDEDTTHAQIMAAFDRAIALAERG